MRIHEMFPGRFLRAADLESKAPVEVAIRAVKPERMYSRPDQGEVEKWVVYFQSNGRELGRGLVLNVTNARAIAEIVGSDDSADWIGAMVTLHVTDVRMGLEKLRGIRIRAPKLTPASQNGARHHAT